MINPQWFKLPMPQTIFYGPKDVRAIEVRLYAAYPDLNLQLTVLELPWDMLWLRLGVQQAGQFVYFGLMSSMLKFFKISYLNYGLSGSSQIWTTGTLEGWFSFHDRSEGLCPEVGLKVKI